MAGKARVHELAKELGVSSKDVLARLNDQGEFVKSASSTVEAPVARRLRESFGGSKPAPAKGPARGPAKSPGNALDASLDKALDKAVGNGEAASAPAKPGAPGRGAWGRGAGRSTGCDENGLLPTRGRPAGLGIGGPGRGPGWGAAWPGCWAGADGAPAGGADD